MFSDIGSKLDSLKMSINETVQATIVSKVDGTSANFNKLNVKLDELQTELVGYSALISEQEKKRYSEGR